jgi:hypothetical protein
MKQWCFLLICASVALTACMTDETDEDGDESGLAVDEQALTSMTGKTDGTSGNSDGVVSTLTGSCGTWSSWSWDGYSIECGVRLACGTYCDEYGNCEVNPASYRQEYSYRVCFDQNGNYLNTEYQYRKGSLIGCGC